MAKETKPGSVFMSGRKFSAEERRALFREQRVARVGDESEKVIVRKECSIVVVPASTSTSVDNEQEVERKKEKFEDDGSDAWGDGTAAWTKVFDRLDSADGRPDGRIRKRSLVRWLMTMAVEEDGEEGLDRIAFVKELTDVVDRNNDGYLERDEFLELVTCQNAPNAKGSCESPHYDPNRKISFQRLQQDLRTAANAEQLRWCPPPFFTLVMTLVQIGVYIYHVLHFTLHPDHSHVAISWTGPYPACSLLVFSPTRRRELWRYFTYCLAHAGLEHIVVNTSLQLVTGLLLEMANGWKRVATIYVSGILAGSIGTSCLDPDIYIAGASGAVFALVGAHLGSMLLNWKEDKWVMRFKISLRGRMRERKAHRDAFRSARLMLIVLLVLLDLARTLYDTHHLDQRSEGGVVRTSFITHVLGSLVGFLVGFAVIKNRIKEAWEPRAQILAIALSVTALFLGILWSLLGNDLHAVIVGGRYFSKEHFGVENGHQGRCRY